MTAGSSASLDPVTAGASVLGMADFHTVVNSLFSAAIEDRAPRSVHRLGAGTTHDMKSVLSGIFWPSLRSPQYTPADSLELCLGYAPRARLVREESAVLSPLPPGEG